MITIRQIRAARALLDWKQSDLARITGLSLATLNNIEREVVFPRSNTLEIIRIAFEQSGVEFLDADGTRMRTEMFRVQTFEGPDCTKIMLDDVIATLKSIGGEAVWSGVEETIFLERHHREFFDYYYAMREHGLKERAFCHEDCAWVYGPRKVTQYRKLPKGAFGLTNFGVYGNKYALLVFGKKDRLVIIEHDGTAQIHRELFENQWKNAQYISYAKTKFDEDLKTFGAI